MLRGAAYPLAPRFLWECLTSRTVSWFPAPASSNPACRFPALGFPECLPRQGLCDLSHWSDFHWDSKTRTRYPLNRPSTL
jgi:hypothetical protein